ncbi:MAG: hypothetical protein OXU53_08640 [Deltaproteobacteria bacterium]|nr:hypothetical protein [Deltaproteobacteria bacterium]
MSEQTANGRHPHGRNSRLYEIIIGVVLTAMFALLTLMFSILIDSGNRTADQVAALERKVDENSRQITEVRLLLVKMQTTLDLIASGLDIRVEPKDEEQAGPANAPAPAEKLATKDP